MGSKTYYMGLIAAACLFAANNVSAQQSDSPQSVVVSGLKDASKWFRAESQHFIVYSDTSNEDVTQLLNNLEKLDHVLRIYTKKYSTGRGSEQKITLYYYDRMGGFNEAAADEPEEAVGLYNSCNAGIQGYGVNLERIANLSNEQLAKHPLNASMSYLFEAYTRHFLYRYTDIRSPASFIDGFAQYFSTARFSDSQMALGRPPVNVARYLYFLKGRRPYLSYKEIFEPDESKDMGYTAEAELRLEFQAKSWLLMHYMLAPGANPASLERYLDLVHHDVPAGKAFEDAFALKRSDIDNAMWRYRNKGVEVVQTEMLSLPAARISFTSLPESSTDFVLADAALKSCPHPKAGESLLRTLSQRSGGVPNNAFAKLTLSRAHIDWGNPQDALPYLTEATRKDAANFDAVYLLGMANLRLAGQHKESARDSYLQAAKRHFALARKLNPKSAEAAYAFYKADMSASDMPGASALDGAIAAWKNAHEVNTYARSAALAFAYSGRAPEADRALTLLAHNARDPEMAKWAKAWQGRLNSGVSRADLLAEMRREPSSHTAFKEWTVAGEYLMQTAIYNAGVEDSSGYVDQLMQNSEVRIDRPRKK